MLQCIRAPVTALPGFKPLVYKMGAFTPSFDKHLLYARPQAWRCTKQRLGPKATV